MPTIPTGFSLVTHVMSLPAPGGAKDMTVTYGVANSPAPLIAQDLHVIFDQIIWDVLGTDDGVLTSTVMRDEVFAADHVSNYIGGNSNEALPPNTALLVRKQTGMIGRAQRGRFYFPGMLYENTIDGAGQMTGLVRTSYQEHFDDWLTAVDDSSANGMVLLHSTELAPTPITSLEVDGTIATQRRRLR